jgi:hypothetical protein
MFVAHSRYISELTVLKFRVFWDVALCSHVEVDQRVRGAYCASIIRVITLMTEAVRISEMSAIFNVTTWHYIPEDSKLHVHCRENLKSHMTVLKFCKLNLLLYKSIHKIRADQIEAER